MNYGYIDFKFQLAPAEPKHRLKLAPAHRICAVEACQRPLSRLNSDSICFRCQDDEREHRIKRAISSGYTKNGNLVVARI